MDSYFKILTANPKYLSVSPGCPADSAEGPNTLPEQHTYQLFPHDSNLHQYEGTVYKVRICETLHIVLL